MLLPYWPITSSNILIVDRNIAKRGLKVIDCIVVSAEYLNTGALTLLSEILIVII